MFCTITLHAPQEHDAEAGQGSYECDVCGKRYPDYEAAERCESSHSEGAGRAGSYECDVCGKAYPDYDGAAACEVQL